MKDTLNNKPELMAPAGDWTMLRTAINAGADAVYFGVDKLNMRAKAKNFTLEDLPSLVNLCKEKNVKTYLTINTIVFEEEIVELEKIITSAKKAGVLGRLMYQVYSPCWYSPINWSLSQM